jgi:ribonuclease T1
MKFRRMIRFCLLVTMGVIAAWAPQPACSERCEVVVRELNQSLHPKIDETELFVILKVLSETDNRKLPPKFVTKDQARKLGWNPGSNLWGYDRLKGKSIGGDVFGNREGRLPNGKRVWREADLDYKGGRRGSKRIVYSDDGLRMITVDHYKTFKEVPPCQ